MSPLHHDPEGRNTLEKEPNRCTNAELHDHITTCRITLTLPTGQKATLLRRLRDLRAELTKRGLTEGDDVPCETTQRTFLPRTTRYD